MEKIRKDMRRAWQEDAKDLDQKLSRFRTYLGVRGFRTGAAVISKPILDCRWPYGAADPMTAVLSIQRKKLHPTMHRWSGRRGWYSQVRRSMPH